MGSQITDKSISMLSRAKIDSKYDPLRLTLYFISIVPWVCDLGMSIRALVLNKFYPTMSPYPLVPLMQKWCFTDEKDLKKDKENITKQTLGGSDTQMLKPDGAKDGAEPKAYESLSALSDNIEILVPDKPRFAPTDAAFITPEKVYCEHRLTLYILFLGVLLDCLATLAIMAYHHASEQDGEVKSFPLFNYCFFYHAQEIAEQEKQRETISGNDAIKATGNMGHVKEPSPEANITEDKQPVSDSPSAHTPLFKEETHVNEEHPNDTLDMAHINKFYG